MAEEHETLATEIIRELKHQNRRMFVAMVIQLVIIVFIVVAFLWYVSLPMDEVVIENDEGNANYIGNDLEGDLYNGKDNPEETGLSYETEEAIK